MKTLNSFQEDLSSGKLNLKDLRKTLGRVIKSVQNNLNPETLETLNKGLNVVDAVDRGEEPDISGLLDLVRNIKL
jgi:hypothetical protein